MDCPMMGKGMMDKSMTQAGPMMEARLAYIKADLEITEAQTTAWEAYAAAVRARHTAMEGMHADMMKAEEKRQRIGAHGRAH
jgi:LTXXQ motif family protein